MFQAGHLDKRLAAISKATEFMSMLSDPGQTLADMQSTIDFLVAYGVDFVTSIRHRLLSTYMKSLLAQVTKDAAQSAVDAFVAALLPWRPSGDDLVGSR